MDSCNSETITCSDVDISEGVNCTPLSKESRFAEWLDKGIDAGGGNLEEQCGGEAGPSLGEQTGSVLVCADATRPQSRRDTWVDGGLGVLVFVKATHSMRKVQSSS